MFLLDTNICIAYLKGDAACRREIDSRAPREIALSSVAKAELLHGANNSKRVATNLRALEMFFAPFASFSFDDQAAEIYGLIAAALQKQGRSFGVADAQMASIAIATQSVLVTRNVRDFEQVPGLRFDRW